MEELSDLLEKFDERLYALNVENVSRREVSRIVDPTNLESNGELVVCYDLSPEQETQLAFVVWQVATRERNQKKPRNCPMFRLFENKVNATRDALVSSLLHYVAGDEKAAIAICKKLYTILMPKLEMYLKNWEIIPRPNTIWVDKKSNGIFLAQHDGKIVVGINPKNYIFVYNSGK